MNIKVDLIPKGRKRRPGIANTIKYITIHNTGLNNVPADNFRRSVLDISQDQEVSWHYTVDEKEIIQHIPDNEVAWHAGNKTGNYESIGIEICERPGSEEKAIELIIYLMKKYNLDISKVRTHKSWSGKQCPHLILPRWDSFIKDIQTKMNGQTNQITKTKIKINANIKEVECINIQDTNYIKLRDLETPGLVEILYDNVMKMPVVNINTKK